MTTSAEIIVASTAARDDRRKGAYLLQAAKEPTTLHREEMIVSLRCCYYRGAVADDVRLQGLGDDARRVSLGGCGDTNSAILDHAENHAGGGEETSFLKTAGLLIQHDRLADESGLWCGRLFVRYFGQSAH